MTLLTISMATSAGATGKSAGVIAVADFARGVSTAQRGQVFVAGGNPDLFRDTLTDAGSPMTPCWRIDVSADAPRAGLAAIVPLFDNRSGERDRKLLDARGATHCCVRAIGDWGGRSVYLDAVPGIAQTPERAGVRLGSIEHASSVDSAEWRTVTFALDPSSTGFDTLGGLQLRFEGEGPAWLAVAAIWLTDDADSPPPAWPSTVDARRSRTALWVWHSAEIAADSRQIDELIAFSRRHDVTDLYVQVPYEFADGSVRLLQTDGLSELNTDAADASISVHALDGAPQYVLRDNHARMLALVDALAEFNAKSPPEARFRAVHLDNEPYVLPEWRDRGKRESILRDYIALNTMLSERVRAAGMAFGVDIPFWWDEVSTGGTAEYTVEISGEHVPLLDALFKLVDNVGIMSYRQRVTGPNGVIGCCMGEFDLASRYNVDVFAAVELGTGPNVEPGISFGELPLSYFRGQWDTLKRALAHEPGCAGVALHYYRRYLAWEKESS